MNRQYLTIQEVSERLRITDETAVNWAKSGRFKILKLGPKLWRIDRASFEAFIKGSVHQKEDAAQLVSA